MSVPIHIWCGEEDEVTEEKESSKEGKTQPQCFVDMQKSMEEELERRRKEWEKDVEAMQHDFFQVNPAGGSVTLEGSTRQAVGGSVRSAGEGDSTNGNRSKNHMQMLQISPSNRKSDCTEIYDVSKSSTVGGDIPVPEAGRHKFKLRFDVYGFEPRDIRIRADFDKITVSAKHHDSTDSTGAKTTRQFNRQVDVPDNVNPNCLTSYLSPDGVLTVEAPYESTSQTTTKAISGQTDEFLSGYPTFPDMPMEEPHLTHHTTQKTRYGSPTSSRPTQRHLGSGSPLLDERELSPPRYHSVVKSSTVSAASPIIYASGMSHSVPKVGPFDYNSARIEDGAEGRRLWLVIDLGGKYKPKDIDMHLVGQKIMLKAKHEEKFGGRTSRCEFSREFELPEAIEGRTLRAMMAPDGMITVGASVKGNTNHDEVLEAVLVDMPSGGKPCTVSKE